MGGGSGGDVATLEQVQNVLNPRQCKILGLRYFKNIDPIANARECISTSTSEGCTMTACPGNCG